MSEMTVEELVAASRRNARVDLLIWLGFPDKEAIKVLDSTEDTIASQNVRTWLKRDRKDRVHTMVLTGAAGSGKTIAAACWLVGNVDVGWINPLDITEWMGMTFAKKAMCYLKAYELGRLNLRYNPEDRTALGRLKDVQFLVIDDLGAEDASSVGVVEELVDHRTARDRYTLITTNLPCLPEPVGSPFGQRYGQRTVDRIAAAGVFIKTGAENLRVNPRRG